MLKGAKQAVRSVRATEAVTINWAANVATSTEVINLSESSAVGIIVPSGLNGVTLTFTVSDKENGTFVTLNGFSAITLATGANALSSANATVLLAFPFAKAVLGSAPGSAISATVLIKS